MAVKKLYLGLGAGAIGVIAAGAIGYASFNSKPTSAPGANPTTASKPSSSGPVISNTDDTAVSEFKPTTDAMVVTTPTAAYVEPSLTAPQYYPLKVSTPIQGTEKSTDGKWLLAMTADGTAAYIPTSTLGPYDAPAAPDSGSPSAPASGPLSGTAKVIDTATLLIGAQQISLAGISGEAGDDAKNMQSLINANGGSLTCQPQADKYVCELPKVGDIARMALFNGAAMPTSDATDDYRKQADAAKLAHRGLWAKAGAAADSAKK